MEISARWKSMSYLGIEVKRILEKNGLKQIDITRRSKTSVASVSRIINGGQPGNQESLDEIIDAIAKTRQDRLDLIIAGIKDFYQGKHKDLIEPMLTSAASESPPLFVDVRLEPTARLALNTLLQLMPCNPAIGHLLVNLQKAIALGSIRK
jgi:hypothetical protein